MLSDYWSVLKPITVTGRRWHHSPQTLMQWTQVHLVRIQFREEVKRFNEILYSVDGQLLLSQKLLCILCLCSNIGSKINGKSTQIVNDGQIHMGLVSCRTNSANVNVFWKDFHNQNCSMGIILEHRISQQDLILFWPYICLRLWDFEIYNPGCFPCNYLHWCLIVRLYMDISSYHHQPNGEVTFVLTIPVIQKMVCESRGFVRIVIYYLAHWRYLELLLMEGDHVTLTVEDPWCCHGYSDYRWVFIKIDFLIFLQNIFI